MSIKHSSYVKYDTRLFNCCDCFSKSHVRWVLLLAPLSSRGNLGKDICPSHTTEVPRGTGSSDWDSHSCLPWFEAKSLLCSHQSVISCQPRSLKGDFQETNVKPRMSSGCKTCANVKRFYSVQGKIGSNENPKSKCIMNQNYASERVNAGRWDGFGSGKAEAGRTCSSLRTVLHGYGPQTCKGACSWQ